MSSTFHLSVTAARIDINRWVESETLVVTERGTNSYSLLPFASHAVIASRQACAARCHFSGLAVLLNSGSLSLFLKLA
ncbi:hypothetical protein D3C87_1769230 [compost metagenome]